MNGKTYADVVHLFSLQRAGYVPHLVSTYLKDVTLVQNLFDQSETRIIICDTKDASDWEKLEGQFDIVPMLNLDEPPSVDASQILLPSLIDGDADDILSMEQSSGSSSGRPKIVQFSRRWVDANAQKCQIDERRTPVFIRSGTFCYVGQLLRMVSALRHLLRLT